MNEIARNNPKDQLTNRSFNNQEGCHIKNSKKNKEKNINKKQNKN